jgi:glutathione S-transferase/GST-like protein
MADVTLYHWEPNANSGKPMLALAEKGVAFDSHYLDLLNFDQHDPDYLKINPAGTIPAMVHGDRMLTESTAIMEYVDETFGGPSLLAPSFSMLGWSEFIGPAVRSRDPEVLEAKINRIPMEERRVAWRKAIYNRFSAEELAESKRRCVIGTRMLEDELTEHKWIGSDHYSLADANGFNLAYIIPLGQPDLANDTKTPHLMEWLRKIYERPATQQIWTLSRVERMSTRVKFLAREAA